MRAATPHYPDCKVCKHKTFYRFYERRWFCDDPVLGARTCVGSRFRARPDAYEEPLG